MSIFQNVDWVASLVVVVSLVVTFAIVNVRLRLSLLRREAKQLSQDVMRLTTWAEDRRLSQLELRQCDRHFDSDNRTCGQ